MARRATLDRGAPVAAAAEPLPTDPGGVRAGRPASQPWRGSGGRWVVWVLRGIAWLVLLLIGYRGVTAIVAGPAPASSGTPATAPASASGFPQTLAGAYALQFGNAYLNFSPATATRRSSELAAYLPPGTDSQFGWNGAGTEHLQSEQVASIKVLSGHSAIVTLLAEVNNHAVELAVPIYADGASMAVSGQPALLPPPARATPPAAAPVNTDQATATALLGQLPSFFRAYATGEQVTLGRFLAPGAQVTGLGGVVSFGSIQTVMVPTGGSTRHITVVVNWNISSGRTASRPPASTSIPASLQMTYRMTVVRRAANWYVSSIGASSQSPGPP
ncbi:MAG TPA: conjugal transfer protein [Streptosporangiaceae bacterium]